MITEGTPVQGRYKLMRVRDRLLFPSVSSHLTLRTLEMIPILFDHATYAFIKVFNDIRTFTSKFIYPSTVAYIGRYEYFRDIYIA